MTRLAGRLLLMVTVVTGLCAVQPRSAPAQNISDTLVTRALGLEAEGQPRYAVPLYRRALRGTDAVTALLGLERVYAELGMTDSLLTPLDSMVALLPADPTVRTVQLRTLNTLGREAAMREAVHDWAQRAPGDPSPYRALARLLLASGRATAADSVITVARHALGGTTLLAHEIAQVRAVAGAWEASAEAWRSALETQPWLSHAAANALAPAPAPRRPAVRAAFMKNPVDPPARLALASLEARWGSPGAGWEALRDLAPDSAAAEAWTEFGALAELDGRWAHARDAFEAALGWRDVGALRLRAASAALASGDAAAALALAPLPAGTVDSQQVATEHLPLHVRALAMTGRPAEAERLTLAFDRFTSPGLRAALAREVGMGWVRTGNLTRARAALAASGTDADSSAVSGWIALYEGDAQRARALLGRGEEKSAEVALALAILARFRDARAPDVGAAFLALARGDTARAAELFGAAAAAAPQAASLLHHPGARLQSAAGDTAAALKAWDAIAAQHAGSAEAPEALLLSARALLSRGDRTPGIARLEQLLLTYPTSALAPVARRELELVRGAVPDDRQ